jgi:hypothetical protein
MQAGAEPQRAKVQLGDLAMFKADTDAEYCTWVVRPNVAGLLPMDKGKSCIFSNREPGNYTIILGAGGPKGVVVTLFELEIVGPVQPEPIVVAPPPRQRAPAPLVDDDYEENLPQVIARLASKVPAADRNARVSESKIVAGCFRSVVSGMKTGTFPANADPYVDVQRQAQSALGVQAYMRWRGFFEGLAPEMAAETVQERMVLYAGVGQVLAGLR